MSQRTGGIGSHSVKPRSSSVAISAGSSPTPRTLSDGDAADSKAPMPSGSGDSVPAREPVTKATKATLNSCGWPTARSIAHSVAASSRKIAI